MMLSDQDGPPASWETVGTLTCNSLPPNIVAEITCYCKGNDCNIHNNNLEDILRFEDNGSDDDNGSDGASNIQLGLGLVVAIVLIREI